MPPVFDLLYLSANCFHCFLFIVLNVEYYEEIAEKVSVEMRVKQLKNTKVDSAEMEKEIKKLI